MMRTINLTKEIPPERKVQIEFPNDVPVGLAEIVVVVSPRTAAPVSTLGDLLHSEFFGMWRDRADIGDSSEFARRLRVEAWSRAV